MTLKRLGQKFVDSQVVHATGIEEDIIQCCYDFCMLNVQDFNNEPTYGHVYESMLNILSGNETDIEEICDFTHETLFNFMDSLSPIGCFFGEHHGDGTQGYWQIINRDIALLDFENIERLPYKHEGYIVLPYNSEGVIDDINNLDDFLLDNVLEYSPCDDDILEPYANSELSQMTEIKDTDHAELMKTFVINSIMPLLAPKGFEWRTNEIGDHGLFRKLPSYYVSSVSNEYHETVRMINEASDMVKLVYIVDNKCGYKLELDNTDNTDLTKLCMTILNDYHFVSFKESQLKVENFYLEDAIEFITQNNYALNWVIESMFFDRFKSFIQETIGGLDITQLWLDCLSSGSVINGIEPNEVYSLRESCNECIDVESTESAKWNNRECACDDYNELSNVWLINNESFYEELKACGAMVYESDSYYMYIQATFSGNWYDSLLRKAWLTYNAKFCMRKLEND